MAERLRVLILLVAVFCCVLFSSAAVLAQEPISSQSAPAGQSDLANSAAEVSSDVSESSDGKDSVAQSEIRMYALMEPPRSFPGPLGRTMKKFRPLWEGRHIGRPMMVWYYWANQPKPFLGSFLIMLFLSVTLSSLMPQWTANAQVECKTRFWKTFFFGILVLAVSLTFVRVALISMIGWPLAVVLMGVVQLAVASGLSVMTLLLGQSIGYRLKADKWISRPDVRRLFCILLGALAFALLLQIPGVLFLPRIGTRLVALLAIVGIGGLFRCRRINAVTVQ